MAHERPPLWSIGLLALLLAAGLRRQWRSETDQRSQTGATPLDDGHGRSATTPSEIPVRGWKDILLRVYEGIYGPYFDRPLGHRARAGHGGYGLLDPIDSAYKRVGFLSMKLFQAAKDAASAQNAEKT
jgi:hypothetical protein